MKKSFLICLLIAVICCQFVNSANATTVTYAGNATGMSWYYGGGGVVGNEFIANQNLELTQLGIFGAANGLSDSHEVGLFSTNGTLLSSVSITAGTSIDANGYAWAPTTPVTLTKGTEYVVAALYPTGTDWFRDTATINPSFTQVTNLIDDGPSFRMPTVIYSNPYGGNGWFGPNLQATSVPEPSSFMLFSVGIAGLAFYKKRLFK